MFKPNRSNRIRPFQSATNQANSNQTKFKSIRKLIISHHIGITKHNKSNAKQFGQLKQTATNSSQVKKIQTESAQTVSRKLKPLHADSTQIESKPI